MKIKLFLSVLVGFVLGVAAMWFVVEQTTIKAFNNMYLVGVTDQANVALHIRSGKQMTLLANIEAALPSYALAVDERFKGHAASTNALWMIKAYYERSEIAFPPEIKNILEALPDVPPPSCQIHLRALDQKSTTNTTETGGPK